ncbi:MAG: MBL fold metallo-hydrolase [Clostridiales bacterium]|nr:MBL fold metallo-hydrolase [Clostridiales bacterium]
MRMVSIASGSSGNCIYIGSERTHILIDAGISTKRIEQGLRDIGLCGSDLDAVVITHEHSDHVRGLSVMAKKFELPIYATGGTLAEIRHLKYLGEYPQELLCEVMPDVRFGIGDLELLPFSIDHDAVNPVAYRVKNGRGQVAVATDMGHYDQYTVDHLMGLDAVLLEANHDVNMLLAGKYPYYLKQRILGDHGHLSNENAGRLLSCILNDHLKQILLGHLSKENNYEALAYETVKLEIDQGDSPYRAKDFPITVAGRDRMSEIITIE